MTTGSDGRLDWIDRTPLADGGCITLVAASQRDEVAAAFGGEGSQAYRLRLEEVWPVFGEEPMVALRPVGEWLLAVEVNGWQGSRPEVLKRVSRIGHTVSAFWNVNVDTRFSLADRGEVLTAFEALSPEYRGGTDPDGLETVRASLPWANPTR